MAEATSWPPDRDAFGNFSNRERDANGQLFEKERRRRKEGGKGEGKTG